MEFFELTKQRASYRDNYTTKKIPAQDIKLILSAALNAPTGCNAQSTEFVVITDSDLLTEISNIFTVKSPKTADAIILCVINENPIPVVNGMSFEIEDCAAAVMSMLLAITELGYASVWVDGEIRQGNKDKLVADLIGLPKNKRIQVMLPIGEPVELKSQPIKKSQEQRVSFNKYSL